MKDSAVVYSRAVGLLIGEDAQAQVSGSIIDATHFGPEGGQASGIVAVAARVVVEDSLVRASEDAALVFVSGEGIVKRTHFVNNPVGVHISETTIVDATEDPQSSSKNQLILFQNQFEGTETPVREAPYEPPTDPTPLGT